MASVITFDGKVQILSLITENITHIGFGGPNPAWSDEFDPPLPSESLTQIPYLLGYAKVDDRGWVEPDSGGSIKIDGQNYSFSNDPTTIAYVKATLPSGVLEGTSNRISSIGAIGGGPITDPTNLTFATPSQITDLGVLIRIRYIPVYVKPENTKTEWYILFPLVS